MTVSHHRVEVRPVALSAAADRLEHTSHQVARSVQTLTEATPMVRFGQQDLRFRPASFLSESAAARAQLLALCHETTVDANLCRTTVEEAMVADGGTSLLCSIPHRYRRPVDQYLTGLLSGGLRAVSRYLIGLAGSSTAPGYGLGDPTGTYSARSVDMGPAADSHPNVVAFALAATADPSLLRHDEFGLIDHGQQRFTVVLPGVTDLSHPQLGWDPKSRTVRDLDMAAVESAGRSGLASNLYASMVAEGLALNGVEEGAALVVIGHSFGADTALDLTSDHVFVDRYDIAQVIAAGYHSEPQLADVPVSVETLVVQNRNDLVIDAERLMPSNSWGVLGCHDSNTVPPSETGTGSHVVRFGGGFSGLGHNVEHYYGVFADPSQLPSGEAAVVAEVLTRLDAGGFAGPATMKAIDVSVPASD